MTGTNTVSYLTAAETESVGLFTSTPLASTAQTYWVAGVAKDPEVEGAELQRRLVEQIALGDALLIDDARTLTGIPFKIGVLVEEDQGMAKFMRWAAAFPKAAPTLGFE